MSVSNIHDAKTNLSKLVAAAERGEEMIIARAGKPAVRLVACGAVAAQSQPRRHLFGAWKDLAPLPTDEEWAEMDREIEKSFKDSEIFPEKFTK